MHHSQEQAAHDPLPCSLSCWATIFYPSTVGMKVEEVFLHVDMIFTASFCSNYKSISSLHTIAILMWGESECHNGLVILMLEAGYYGQESLTWVQSSVIVLDGVLTGSPWLETELIALNVRRNMEGRGINQRTNYNLVDIRMS